MKPSVSKPGKPAWLKKRLPLGGQVSRVEKLVHRFRLNTVCHGAKCPNRNDCYEAGTATFLILGDTCTRHCRFCSIPGGAPVAPDPEEPKRLAEAVQAMGLSYVVLTSVTRDDLEDGGASIFAATIQALRTAVPGIGIEVLIPDFKGNADALAKVLQAGPTVLNHNIETVPSLYERVRPGADYDLSLRLLSQAADWPGIPAKSGIMVGLGETQSEVLSTLNALRDAGVSMITIGQYLQPGPNCLEVAEFIEPERFAFYARAAYDIGFTAVASGPFVRSSHRAGQLYQRHLVHERRMP